MTKARELAKLGEVMTNSQIGGRRNLILNPKMAIAQRGTSTTGVGASTPVFPCVDRFRFVVGGTTAGRATVSQSTDAPNGFANSLKIDVTTADTSIASTEALFLNTLLEGQDLQQIKKGTSDAESLTLSFYVKGNASATYTCELRDLDNDRINTQTFSVTTSWNRVILTFIPDTTGAFNNDNGASLQISFILHAGSDYTSGTFASNTWASRTQANRVSSSNTSIFDSTDRELFITGVQLEVGSYPNGTPFEHRSFGEELKLCQRYFQKTYNYGEAIGNTSNSNGSNTFNIDDNSIQRDGVRLIQTMRTNPTIVVYNPVTGGTASIRTNHPANYSASVFQVGENGYFTDYTPSNGEFIQFHHTADAEL